MGIIEHVERKSGLSFQIIIKYLISYFVGRKLPSEMVSNTFLLFYYEIINPTVKMSIYKVIELDIVYQMILLIFQ